MDTYVLDEPVTARLDPQQVFSALAMEASWLVALPEEAHDLLVQTRRDNELVAGRVRAATTAGRLDAGLCGWLADLCLFHWNRVGLPADTARPLASTITAVLRRPL